MCLVLGMLIVVTATTSAQSISDYLGRWHDESDGMLPMPINHLDIADNDTFYTVGVYEGMGEEVPEGISIFGEFSGWGVITWRRDDDGNLLGGSAVVDHRDHNMHHYLWMTLDGDTLRVESQKNFTDEASREQYLADVQLFGHYESTEVQYLDRLSTDTGADGAFGWE